MNQEDKLREEVLAIDAIVKALVQLPSDSRQRVLAFVSASINGAPEKPYLPPFDNGPPYGGGLSK